MKRFYENFVKLNDLERKLLFIFAISYEPFPKSNALLILKQLRVQNIDGKSANTVSLKSALQKLKTLDLVDTTPLYIAKPIYSEIIMAEATKDPLFEPITNAIQKIYPINK